tara:strand:- start:273 stop:539 length:267 start_codon:yes stop_codon:yes gene_type:complete
METKGIYKGLVSNLEDAKRIVTQIESEIEDYTEEGLEDCPNVEDLSVVLSDLEVAIENNSFPIQLEFVNFGLDLYRQVLETIEDLDKE